jgi:putative addiction module component (TIGR02574 family)
MPMTPDQIIEEARHWPPEQLAELVDRLTLTLHHAVDPEINNAWKHETRRRLADIESGRIQAVPGEGVSAKIRRIVGR